MRKCLTFLVSIAIACAFSACRGFRGFTFRTPTDSMAPTIKAGDSVFADPTFYKHSDVQRGDVVIVIDPDGNKNSAGQPEMYIKRVVGLAGDKVQVMSARVYVNDRVVDGVLGSGNYYSRFPVDDFGPLVVPQKEYFLIGDNLPDSIDSRMWKYPIRMEGIYGKVTTVKDGKTGTIRYL